MRYRHVGKPDSDALAKLKQAIGQPDSGEHRAWCSGNRIDSRGTSLGCDCRPDSDAHEVCGAMVARVNGYPLESEMARGHDGAHEAKLAGPLSASGGPVLLSLDLAQRILAALDMPSVLGNRERIALAAELRALVTK